MLSLNENIKKLRLSRGLSQVEFAKILCVTKQCVSNWENDNVIPFSERSILWEEYIPRPTDPIHAQQP